MGIEMKTGYIEASPLTSFCVAPSMQQHRLLGRYARPVLFCPERTLVSQAAEPLPQKQLAPPKWRARPVQARRIHSEVLAALRSAA